MADSHIRVIKHDSPIQRKVLLYIGAILIALLIGAVLLLGGGEGHLYIP